MRWTERQQAMLREMGLRLWLPGAPAADLPATPQPAVQADQVLATDSADCAPETAAPAAAVTTPVRPVAAPARAAHSPPRPQAPRVDAHFSAAAAACSTKAAFCCVAFSSSVMRSSGS